jgi:anti-sigma-K factor RskA
MKLTGEQLELLASQYADGTISILDRAAFEAQLPVDAEARLLVNQDVHLTQLLRDTHAMPVLDLQTLSTRISQAVEDEKSYAPASATGMWGRRFALAACVGIAATVATLFAWRFGSTSDFTDNVITKNSDVTASSIALVSGPAAETSAGPVVVRIQIGPADNADAPANLALQDTANTRPARVVIAAADTGPESFYEQHPLR